MLSPDISEDGFNQFVDEMEARHAGAGNMGRNQIAVQGEFDVKELRPLPDGLPYQQSRDQARDEELAVAGVSGAKLGLVDDMSNANLKENRREYHETSMVPLFRMVELCFYEQIHQREFGYDGWEFKFNAPDFLTAVEKATVHMRYHGMGVLNPNEIRHDLGKPPREDEGGNAYFDPAAQQNEQGSPPEGRPQEPDDPSQTGEPTLDDQDPPRGDGHDEETEHILLAADGALVLEELRTWERFAKNRAKRNKPMRVFRSDILPKEVIDIIHSKLSDDMTQDDVAYVFEGAYETVRELWGN